MTPQDIAHVQRTFALVAPQAPAVAALFYQRLFELDPSLRPLFSTDLTEQGRKLMAMLGAVVAGLNHLERLVPVAQDLARRHVGYGVQPAHYQTVGAALLDTLQQGLGDGFTPEVKAAWTTAYTTLAGVMVAAAHPDAPA
ncbi:globin family protein [Aquabacterium sp. J223]|uniref:globin family protein n=1 Tax=Aquabacterium sp. J223 TaxID=2898431 RepID=UPI0021AE0153|nr:globin family protein [Aquabacterium sp. J223]UUX95163.1 globin domain-containing protein [Aquabacterium sp. J223]